MTKKELENEVRRLRSENRKLMQIVDRAMEQMYELSKREAERRWPLPTMPYSAPTPYFIPEITCSVAN